MSTKRNISIIGGAGHIGFPLGLILSSKGFEVSLIDKNRDSFEIMIKRIEKLSSPE